MKQIKQIFLEGESPTLNFDQFLSKMLVLFAGRLQKISGAIKNWSNWSKIVAVRFPTITSLEMKLEKTNQSFRIPVNLRSEQNLW